MKDSSDGRSPVAIAASWASRVLTISLEMVLPGLAGYWLDQRLGTRVLFLLIGLALGMALAMWQLVQLASSRK